MKYVDNAGEPIYFKESYFDDGARRWFRSAEEKRNFLRAHNFVQNGDSDEKVKKERKAHYEQKMDMKSRMV